MFWDSILFIIVYSFFFSFIILIKKFFHLRLSICLVFWPSKRSHLCDCQTSMKPDVCLSPSNTRLSLFLWDRWAEDVWMDLSELLAEVCWTPDLFLVCFVSVGRHSCHNIVQTLSEMFCSACWTTGGHKGEISPKI